jgi:hypothetical protein
MCFKVKRLRVGAALNDVSFSGEDGNLRAYYHGEKKFFLRMRMYGPTAMQKKG